MLKSSRSRKNIIVGGTPPLQSRTLQVERRHSVDSSHNVKDDLMFAVNYIPKYKLIEDAIKALGLSEDNIKKSIKSSESNKLHDRIFDKIIELKLYQYDLINHIEEVSSMIKKLEECFPQS